MKPIGKMSGAELAAFVQEHLRGKGIDMVLCGGACVSIYSRGQYVSMDLDLVHTGLMAPKRSLVREVMRGMGFSEAGWCFRHPDTDFFVEFPKGPPSVGEEPVKEIHERKETTGTLKILSPTDCVKDRLTWYYYDNDGQCLDQAILVAQQNKSDLTEIERWSSAEGRTREFKRIRDRLRGRRTRSGSRE
jgi:hypothetical protein